jgi:hypothetical protein
MLGLHAWARRSETVRIWILMHYLLILLLLGSLLAFAAASWEGGPPVHVGPVIAVLLAIMLAFAAGMAATLSKRVPHETMPAALPRVELFQPKNRGDFKGDTPWLARVSIAFLPVLRYPLQLFLPPALAALLVSSEWVVWASLGAGFVAWLLLYLGILFERLMEILKTVGRLFFIGPQRILSATIIVIAVGRWWESHFIDYLFDNPFGNWTILSYIVFAYAVAWFYGFWCEILLARRFIRLFSDGVDHPMQVDYHFLGDEGVTRVENAGRTIALHGAGRLRVEGDYDAEYRRSEAMGGDEKALAFLTPAEFIADVRTQLEDHAWDKEKWGKDPLPRARDLQRGINAYPGITGLAVLVCFGGTLAASYAFTSQPAELDIVWDEHVDFPLKPLLFDKISPPTGRCMPLTSSEPRIAVVASGGGTRAAIYTAAVLRGLAMEDRICNVVLASGVSGGSAALAYFAVNQETLRVPREDFDQSAWDAFDKAMAMSYIQEVLDDASASGVVFGSWRSRPPVCDEAMEEPDTIRSAGWWPARVRFGSLLAESFACEMTRELRNKPGPKAPFGSMDDVPFGLILNTSLTGEFTADAYDGDHTVPEQARRERGEPIRRSDRAGGRLILTNLPDPRAARDASLRPGTSDLRFITINDRQMSVARAAALSANFPPVFADAAIDERRSPKSPPCEKIAEEDRDDVCKDVRYWVTDGGAVENRGAVTLYLAIQDALRGRAPDDPLASPDGLPDLHVVVADVSTAGGPYEEGVGLSAVQAAGGQMGLALEQQLLADLKTAYDDDGDGTVVVHELPMPPLLRDAIRTHWMMPDDIALANPDRQATPKSETLSREEGITLVRSLFTDPEEASDIVERVRPWVRERPLDPNGDRTLAQTWQKLLDDLGDRPAESARSN